MNKKVAELANATLLNMQHKKQYGSDAPALRAFAINLGNDIDATLNTPAENSVCTFCMDALSGVELSPFETMIILGASYENEIEQSGIEAATVLLHKQIAVYLHRKGGGENE